MRIAFLGTHHPHVFQRVALLKQRDDVEIVRYWEQDEVIPLKLQERLAIPRFQRAASLLAQPFDIALYTLLMRMCHDWLSWLQMQARKGYYWRSLELLNPRKYSG